jgi:hypothetical protein
VGQLEIKSRIYIGAPDLKLTRHSIGALMLCNRAASPLIELVSQPATLLSAMAIARRLTQALSVICFSVLNLRASKMHYLP